MKDKLENMGDEQLNAGVPEEEVDYDGAEHEELERDQASMRETSYLNEYAGSY